MKPRAGSFRRGVLHYRASVLLEGRKTPKLTPVREASGKSRIKSDAPRRTRRFSDEGRFVSTAPGDAFVPFRAVTFRISDFAGIGQYTQQRTGE